MRLDKAFGTLSRTWIPIVVVASCTVGGFTVYRLHGVFGSQTSSGQNNIRTERIVPTNPKNVIYEVYGPAGTTGMISYLDERARPQEADFSALPWSMSFTTTLPSVTANISAQGDGTSLGCRIVVNGDVRDEQFSTTHNAATFCLVKAA